MENIRKILKICQISIHGFKWVVTNKRMFEIFLFTVFNNQIWLNWLMCMIAITTSKGFLKALVGVGGLALRSYIYHTNYQIWLQNP